MLQNKDVIKDRLRKALRESARAAAGNVVRLRLTMREEGLEWSVAEASDGSIKRTLTPE